MRQLILVFAVMLSGCSTVTPEHSAALLAASHRYEKASVDMTKEQLVQLLGPPQRVEAQLLVWEVRFGSENFESLRVELDSENHVAKITEAHSRFRWGPFDPIARGFPDDASKTSGYVETSGWVLHARPRPQENHQKSNQAPEAMPGECPPAAPSFSSGAPQL